MSSRVRQNMHPAPIIAAHCIIFSFIAKEGARHSVKLPRETPSNSPAKEGPLGHQLHVISKKATLLSIFVTPRKREIAHKVVVKMHSKFTEALEICNGICARNMANPFAYIALSW